MMMNIRDISTMSSKIIIIIIITISNIIITITKPSINRSMITKTFRSPIKSLLAKNHHHHHHNLSKLFRPAAVCSIGYFTSNGPYCPLSSSMSSVALKSHHFLIFLEFLNVQSLFWVMNIINNDDHLPFRLIWISPFFESNIILRG